MGTHVNLRLLLERLRGSKKKEGLCCVFIDYKSAYNTVLRDVLYRALIAKNILNPQETEFLKLMHDCLYFQVETGERFHFPPDEVHQSSPISPALFDIYMEDAMRDIREGCSDKNLWYKLYADDLVLMTTHNHLESLLSTLHEVSGRFNLRVNPKKSAVFV